jgi:hypothetical protein
MKIGQLGVVLIAMLTIGGPLARSADVDPLAVGIAGHAFDHLGAIADQAQAAAASGATIIYGTGFGSIGYSGLPTPEKLAEAGRSISAYVRQAKASGIRLDIGYLCATSIVKLETFDANWTAEFRAQFSTPPAKWLQQDRDGKPLPSWYGGDYRPACMNNPDWRTYEKSMVRLQIESGHDGIFFDNPTVHPQGCYCEHCMTKFGRFLAGEGVESTPAAAIGELRKLAVSRPKDFMRFRCTIAAEFLNEIRTYARTLKPDALMTCNNSLNSPGAFFSQCRTYGYNIHEMSRIEDLVVVEDMESQPRVLADGSAVEYGPMYEMLHAISRGKPVVAVNLAAADYHTPPNLMRLAMAEAAAHGASYLSWPTWPENERSKMIAAVQPQADLLRANAELLNETKVAADVCAFLPFNRWVETAECHTLQIVGGLGRANIQFRVVCEEDLGRALVEADAPKVLVIQSPAVLSDAERVLIEKYKAGGGQVVWSKEKKWLADVLEAVKSPAIVVAGPPTVRGVVRTKGKGTIVHLLNLNVARVSSFEDRVMPAEGVRIKVRCGADRPTKVTAMTADAEGTHGALDFSTVKDDQGCIVMETTIPRLVVATILVIE